MWPQGLFVFKRQMHYVGSLDKGPGLPGGNAGMFRHLCHTCAGERGG